MARIGGLIVDLDGVIRLWPAEPVRAIESEYGLPAGSIEAAALDHPAFAVMLSGGVSRRTWHAAVARDLEARFGRRAREATSRWARLRGTVDDAMLDLIRDARRTCRVALLSNAGHELEGDLRALGIDGAFDVVASSTALGVAKPDPEAFLRTAEMLSTPPSSCLVVDDAGPSVAAARALGMAAIHHRSVDRTRRAMSHLGVTLLAEPRFRCARR